MSKPNGGNAKNTLHCSFCGKSEDEVRKVIAGPTVFICDECVELCADLIREARLPPAAHDFTEFHKAVDFAVFGNGSLADLRRVFSRLIDKALDENKAARGRLDEAPRKLQRPERFEKVNAWKQDLEAELARSVAELSGLLDKVFA
jgi:hypothetical protein